MLDSPHTSAPMLMRGNTLVLKNTCRKSAPSPRTSIRPSDPGQDPTLLLYLSLPFTFLYVCVVSGGLGSIPRRLWCVGHLAGHPPGLFLVEASHAESTGTSTSESDVHRGSRCWSCLSSLLPSSLGLVTLGSVSLSLRLPLCVLTK